MIYKCICVLSEKKMTEAGTQPTPEKKKVGHKVYLRRSLKAMVQKIGLFLHRHDDAQSLLHHLPFCAPFLLPHHLSTTVWQFLSNL